MKSNIYMQNAIKISKESILYGDVPVGAVIVKNKEIIATGYNMREKHNDATLHAEIIAIQNACNKLKSWRLDDCDIYVTLEPCPMCAGAIIQSRIRRLYFGAFDLRTGAAGSNIDLFCNNNVTQIEVYGGIMENECQFLLKDFFSNMRT